MEPGFRRSLRVTERTSRRPCNGEMRLKEQHHFPLYVTIRMLQSFHLDGTIGFTHWLLYNLPGDLQSIGAAHDGHCTGVNDFGYTGYAGPMPPPNHGDHRYFFFLFALSSSAGFPPRLGLRQFVSALEPYTLGISRLMGGLQQIETIES